MKNLKRQFYQFVSHLFSKPPELHVYLVSSWLIHFASQSLPLNQKRAMVFSPHQDDETFGCGGMIALKRLQNVPVSLVFITDGQKAHLYTPWIESPPNLVKIRQLEALKAASILGVSASNVHFLNYEDATLKDLTGESRQQVVNQIAQLLLQDRPEEVYVPHQKDNHPDHEATYELVKAAIAQTQLQVDLWQYPIWLMWESFIFFGLKQQDLVGANRLAIDSVQDRKKDAIAAYQSQHALLPPGMLNIHQTPYEIFFKEQ